MGGVYAVVNKHPKNKTNREVSDLLSTAVRAQLPLDATEQISSWSGQEEAGDRPAHVTQDSRGEDQPPNDRVRKGGLKSPSENPLDKTDPQKPDQSPPEEGRAQGDPHKADRDPDKAGRVQENGHKSGHAQMKKDVTRGYIQLEWQAEGEVKNVPANAPPTVSSRGGAGGKTKFGYSTVVFEKEVTNKELAEKKRQNKPIPQPPPKYDGARSKNSGTIYSDINHRHKAGMPKHMSESGLIYSDIDHKLTNKKQGDSLPDLSLSHEDESGYVNVRHNLAPVVPPRRGAAAIVEEASQ
jgi:hypothetical protein